MINSADEFKKLWTSKEPRDYHRISDDEIPDNVCLAVIEQYPQWKNAVASNPTVSIKILRILACDAEYTTRACVAENPNLDWKLFESLSNDPDESVRSRLIGNPKTPLDILQELAHHPYLLTRKFAKKNYRHRKGLPEGLGGPAVGYIQWFGDDENADDYYGIEKIENFDLEAFIKIFHYEKQAKTDPYMFEAENCWLSEKNVAQVQPYIKHKIDLTKYDYEFVTDEATPSV